MDNHLTKTIYFPKGIPGFEEEKCFILTEEEGVPLAQLDSENNKELGFVLLRPQLFFPEYLLKVDLASEEVDLLEVDADDQLDVWAVMTLSLSDMSKSTVNLRAPLLVNSRTNKGIQIILSDENYSSRQQLFTNSENASEEGSTKEGAVG